MQPEAPLIPVDVEEMLAEVRRELGYRMRVYPRLVAEHKLNHRQAARQIDRMQAIADLLVQLKETPDALPHVPRQRPMAA